MFHQFSTIHPTPFSFTRICTRLDRLTTSFVPSVHLQLSFNTHTYSLLFPSMKLPRLRVLLLRRPLKNLLLPERYVGASFCLDPPRKKKMVAMTKQANAAH